MKLLRVTFITAKGKVVEANAWVQTVLRDGHPTFVAGYNGHAYYSSNGKTFTP